jgi:hypothetical protein
MLRDVLTSGVLGIEARTLGGLLAVVAFAVSACASGDEPIGRPVPGGREVADVQERWWTWAMAEETVTNPVVDESGADCARNQPDDVWFFAGTFGGPVRRSCTVPAGRPIVAPLVNLIAASASDCEAFVSAATGSAELDGRPLVPARMEAEPVAVRGIDGNPITDSSEQFDGVACGLWVTIAAPGTGSHTLTIHGESGDFEVRADYTFEVA